LIWPGQDRFAAIAKMAESGCIAARELRGTFRRRAAGAGFRKSLHRFHGHARHAATQVNSGSAPRSRILPASVAGLDATEDATIDLIND
jgi:hypothetical protein